MFTDPSQSLRLFATHRLKILWAGAVQRWWKQRGSTEGPAVIRIQELTLKQGLDLLMISVCMCLSGLSVDRPCARSVKVDCPCVFSQVCVRGGVVWALSEHKALFYREGLNSFCSEGEGWKYDTVRYCQYHYTTAILL